MEDDKLRVILDKYPEKKRYRKIPYGYKPKEGDPNLLVPDPAIIVLLEQALDQLGAGISIRQACEWLNANTPDGVTLSHMGLSKLRDEYRPDIPKRQNIVPKSVPLTREERMEYNRKLKIANEKRRITTAKKRMEKLKE